MPNIGPFELLILVLIAAIVLIAFAAGRRTKRPPEQPVGGPPAGWYETSDGLLQWWDGTSWTDELRRP